MPPKKLTYKSNTRTDKLPTCLVDIDFFKKLFEILSEINQRAATLEASSLEKKEEETDEDFQNLQEKASDLCRLVVLIYGSKGEYLSSYEVTVFDSPNFPSSISAIIFDNTIDFNFHAKRNPINSIRVEFDFTKPQIFDFSLSPSEPTPNKSNITVQGENEEWVDWAFGKVKSIITERKTSRTWLHRRNIYDLFLVFLIFPLTFWNLYKINLRFDEKIDQTSSVFQVALYVYIFFLLLILARIIFNYSRWVFPYLELDSLSKTNSTRHRIFLVVIFIALVGTLISDLIKFVIPYLF